MLKQLRESNRELEGDTPPPPAACCPPSATSKDALLAETDLSSDRPVTDAELEAITRLLGGDLHAVLGHGR